MTGNVAVPRDGAAATITVNRPEARNAVDGPTAAALADAFRAFGTDHGAAVAVLTGSGDTFPQACLRAEFSNALIGGGLAEEAVAGASRFSGGAGRHGRFDDHRS